MVCQELTWEPWVQLHCSVPPRTVERVEQNLVKFLIVLQTIPDYVVKDTIKKANCLGFFWFFFTLKKNNLLVFKTKFQWFSPLNSSFSIWACGFL